MNTLGLMCLRSWPGWPVARSSLASRVRWSGSPDLSWRKVRLVWCDHRSESIAGTYSWSMRVRVTSAGDRVVAVLVTWWDVKKEALPSWSLARSISFLEDVRVASSGDPVLSYGAWAPGRCVSRLASGTHCASMPRTVRAVT